jgi:hypothetical protein
MDVDEIEAKAIKLRHTKLQTLLEDLKSRRNRLNEDLEKLKTEQERLNKELSTINSKIEERKNVIDEILGDDGSQRLGTDKLNKRCEDLISTFLFENRELIFKVEYGKMILSKEIDPRSDMTFKHLKSEIMHQFDKREEEFYFTDEKGAIFLDNLSVRKCLFPLSRVNIRGNMPVLIVIDKKSKLENLKLNIIKIEKLKIDGDVKIEIRKETIIDKIKKNFFMAFHLICFITFILSWIFSAFFYSNIRDYFVLLQTFNINTGLYSQRIDVDLGQYIKEEVGSYFSFPTEEQLNKGYQSVHENLSRI